MKKISYRSVSIEKISVAMLVGLLSGAKKLVVAIDVAKTKMMAGFGSEDGSIVRLVRFTSPSQTRAFVTLVSQTGESLGVPVEALMEPTGTYGDALRALLREAGAEVFMLSPKRVHDAREVFDGVPSLHDPKACVLLARLHHQEISRRYEERSEERRRMRALVDQRQIYRKPMQQHLGQLEALLSRHWPELLDETDVWTRVTPLKVLEHYGCPAEVARDRQGAEALMRSASRGAMSASTIGQVVDSASRSIGVKTTNEERTLIQDLAREALRLRDALGELDKRLEKLAVNNEATAGLSTAVGRITAVVLVAFLGPLGDYESAAALEKACGLNLKIKSSGNKRGRVSITKRGSAEVRAYLYLAAVRLVRLDPLIGAWYRSRAAYREDRKVVALVAVMRKLIRALWHVARGEPFNADKLIDRRALLPHAPELAISDDSAKASNAVSPQAHGAHSPAVATTTSHHAPSP